MSNTCYIGNVFGVTSSGGAGVFINANGKLGTTTSSRRSSLSLIEVATVFAPRGLILSRSARPPMPPIANSDRQSP